MVVVGILAVLMVIGIVNQSRSKSNRLLDGAAQEMTEALRFARQSGMSFGGTTVTFTTTTNPAKYTITKTTGGQVLKVFTLPLDVTLTPGSGMSPLTFAANGTSSAPSPSGTITVRSNNTGRTGTLTVLQTAGTTSVTIQ